MPRKKTDEPLIIRSYQTEYTVCYTDFEVPVLFTTEEAFLSAHDGEYVLPIPEVRYALLEPKLTELADETADGRVFSCYMLECQATASTGERTSTARMSVKIMVAKQPIIFDDPVVEPWKWFPSLRKSKKVPISNRNFFLPGNRLFFICRYRAHP